MKPPSQRATRIGSLFSGYGGLDLGVMEALGGTVAWHAEFEDAPSRILAHHWPDVPNLGDVTAVDWSAVEPVDIICGGSPCQDVSMAGARKGMRAGTRSGLWASMCDAIETIRPALVVWENVRGALSAGADSNMEPCDLGMGCEGPVSLRALGRVLGDLAELGYDAGWGVVRASDVGAPHRRERVFVLAWPTNARGTSPARLGGHTLAGTGGPDLKLLPTPTVSDANGAGAHGDGGSDLRTAIKMFPTPTTTQRGADANLDTREGARANLHNEVLRLLPTPDAQMFNGGRIQSLESLREGRRQVHMNDLPRLLPTPSVADVEGGRKHRSGARSDELLLNGLAHHEMFGQYAPTIARWEAVLGRPAPAPTEPNAAGNQRLSARFVEWMMGLPEGHVVDVPGITRNQALKALGNGVVPQQAAHAIRLILAGANG